MDEEDRRLIARAEALGFDQQGDAATADFIAALAVLAQPKRVLELGTGLGFTTRRLAAALPAAQLHSVDREAGQVEIARSLAACAHVRFHVGDGAVFLRDQLAAGARYDFIFADAWPGKYDALEEALSLLAPGGLYVIDDMLPQPSWPEDHAPAMRALITRLAADPRLRFQYFELGSGIGVAQRIAA